MLFLFFLLWLCQAATLSKQDWTIHLAQAGARAEVVRGNQQSLGHLHSILLTLPWGQASMHALLKSRVQAFLSLPVSPTVPMTSQGVLSPLGRTPGLERPVCGPNRLLPKVGLCLHNLPFPPSPFQGHKFRHDHFFFLPIWLCVYLSYSFGLQKSFCQLPVSFQKEVLHMYISFWCVHKWREVPHPPTLPCWLIRNANLLVKRCQWLQGIQWFKKKKQEQKILTCGVKS